MRAARLNSIRSFVRWCGWSLKKQILSAASKEKRCSGDLLGVISMPSGPCPVGRHESAIPCAPPTDPTGFIYPSYQAAQTETLTDKPSLNSSHQGVAHLSSAVGGSVSTLSFEDR